MFAFPWVCESEHMPQSGHVSESLQGYKNMNYSVSTGI